MEDICVQLPNRVEFLSCEKRVIMADFPHGHDMKTPIIRYVYKYRHSRPLQGIRLLDINLNLSPVPRQNQRKIHHFCRAVIKLLI